MLKLGMNETYAGAVQVHYIGKDGVDLGDGTALNRGFFDTHKYDISQSYFFSVEELKKGIPLNIEAASIKDIPTIGGEEHRQVYFKRFNISK